MRTLRVLVSGASRLIGRETARALLDEGCSVVMNGRDADALARTRTDLAAGDAGRAARLHAVAADVTDQEEARRLVREATEALGGLDALVNNAGISMRGRLADLDGSVLDAIVRTNIVGACLPTIAALPALRASRGSVVFISSLAGLWGFPGVSIYSASKMALTALAQSLDAEERVNGIHVGTIYVGFTENDDEKRILSSDGSPVRIERGAQARQGDVARQVVRMLARRRRRIVHTPAGWALAAVCRLAPGVLRLVLRRSAGAIHQMSR